MAAWFTALVFAGGVHADWMRGLDEPDPAVFSAAPAVPGAPAAPGERCC